jgi:hypothetical protein
MVAALVFSTLGLIAVPQAERPPQVAPPKTEPAPPPVTKPPKDLSRQLFSGEDRLERQQRLNKQKVLCGLVLQPVDPTIDRGIAPKKPDPSVDAKIWKIEPKVCRE